MWTKLVYVDYGNSFEDRPENIIQTINFEEKVTRRFSNLRDFTNSLDVFGTKCVWAENIDSDLVSMWFVDDLGLFKYVLATKDSDSEKSTLQPRWF